MISLHKHISVAALLIILLTAAMGTSAQAADRDDADLEQLLEDARRSLNRGRYEEAAERFSRVFNRTSERDLAGDALYWEAFARYRLERTSELKRAAELLNLQAREYAMASTAVEGEALTARVYAELAERGEVEAAREIATRASEEELRQETRAAALQALMHMDPRKAMPMLEKIVQDDSPANRDLRHNALFIMCHEGGQEAEELLIKMLKTEDDPEFVAEIIMCLSMVGSKSSLQAVMDVFRTTDDPEVAEAALFSVGQHGGQETFDFLAEVAGDSNSPTETRAQALMALSMTGRDNEVTKLLIQVLENEEDPEIQEMAVMSLSHVDTPESRKAIMDLALKPDTDEDLKTMALHFAAINDDIDLDDLSRLYKGAQSHDLKQQICHVLTLVEDQDAALDLLIEISRNETNPEIKRDAVFWIGQFDNEKAADYLVEILQEQ